MPVGERNKVTWEAVGEATQRLSELNFEASGWVGRTIVGARANGGAVWLAPHITAEDVLGSDGSVRRAMALPVVVREGKAVSIDQAVKQSGRRVTGLVGALGQGGWGSADIPLTEAVVLVPDLVGENGRRPPVFIRSTAEGYYGLVVIANGETGAGVYLSESEIAFRTGDGSFKFFEALPIDGMTDEEMATLGVSSQSGGIFVLALPVIYDKGGGGGRIFPKDVPPLQLGKPDPNSYITGDMIRNWTEQALDYCLGLYGGLANQRRQMMGFKGPEASGISGLSQSHIAPSEKSINGYVGVRVRPDFSREPCAISLRLVSVHLDPGQAELPGSVERFLTVASQR